MADTLPVILNAKIWIPEEHVNLDATQQFHKHLFFDVNCEKCPFYEDRGKGANARPAEACTGTNSEGAKVNCTNYFGRFDLHTEKTTQGVTFHGFPYGNKDALREVYPDVFQHEPLEDRRPRPAMKHPIVFTGTLRPVQEGAVDSVFRKSGTLISKPRTGKTVMATALICRTGLKTLVLGAQAEWLKGFYHHFVGSPKQKAMTNVPELRVDLEQEERDNRKKNKVAWNRKKMEHVVGFPKTVEDYERLDVCLVTYQQLIQITESGQMRMEAIKNMFGYIVIDEVDTANADQFSVVLSMLNAAYKLGITATWDRKDGRQVLMEHLIGGVLHTTETESLRPEVELFESQFVTHTTNWNNLLSSIEKSDELFQDIVENVLIDLEMGHSILIPLRAVDMTIRLYKEINRRYGSLIAAPLLGNTHMPEKKRDKIIERCQLGELRVLIGPYQLLRRGVNIGPLSCLYEILPSSNMPQAEQRMYRILTPEPGKIAPKMKYFLLNNKIHATCVKNEWYGFVVPHLKPIVSHSTIDALKAYFARYSADGQRGKVGREL